MKEILTWYQNMGVDEIIGESPSSFLESPQKQNHMKLSDKKNLVPLNLIELASNLANQANTIEELNKAIINFEGLSIKKTATNTVFSDGKIDSDIMIIGEAPGATEDEQGIPFCGQSGQLLDKVFESIGLSRDKNIYITNSVFWRPPGNRKPTIEETAVCLPFVEKHIALFNPKLIILVGATSSCTILDSNEPISKMRSKFYKYKNKYMHKEVDMAVIFHPSYLLRQSSQKKIVWFDLLKIKKELLQQ